MTAIGDEGCSKREKPCTYMHTNRHTRSTMGLFYEEAKIDPYTCPLALKALLYYNSVAQLIFLITELSYREKCKIFSSKMKNKKTLKHKLWFPWWLSGKGSACNAGDPGSISG